MYIGKGISKNYKPILLAIYIYTLFNVHSDTATKTTAKHRITIEPIHVHAFMQLESI